MGHASALGFAGQVEEGNVSLRAALSWHLTANHYPPVPQAFVATCLAAIEAADDLDWTASVALPQGCNTCHSLLPWDTDTSVAHAGHDIIVDAVHWRDSEEGEAPAGEIIESLHLDAFLGATLPQED